jgi:hypothetical protein
MVAIRALGAHSLRPLLLLLLVASASACASDIATDPGTEKVGHVQQAIIGGTTSDASQDATVMLVLIDPKQNKRLGVCTATMIAPRLVLTARHCLADTNSEVACDANGTPLLGGEVRGDHDAAALFVFTGKDRAPFLGDIASNGLDTTQWKPAGQGIEIIDDKSGTLCNHDLGMLLLKDPINNVPLASLRLDGDVATGEKLLTVGWGVASDEVEPKTRRQRSDVTVKRVGPDEAVPILTKSEFLFDESICLGDSGGPVFSQSTNAILGVVSRGGNGSNGNGGPASTCIGADNVATKVSSFHDLVMEGFNRAGAQPRLEPQPADKSCSASPGDTRRPPSAVAVILSIAALIGATTRRRRDEELRRRQESL